MTKCNLCGTALEDGTKFCPECGAKIEVIDVQSIENSEYDNQLVDGCKQENKLVNSQLLNIVECIDKNKKRELINNFEIKNNKNDICDVATIAFKEIENGNNKRIWLKKLYSCVQKAMLLFPNEQECEQIKILYDTAKKIKYPISNVKMTVVNIAFSLTIIGFFIWFFVALGLGPHSEFGKISISISLSIIVVSIILYIIFRKMFKAVGK